MSSKIRYYICALYIALGPISWMPGIPLGLIKRLLLIVVIFLFYRCFIPLNKAKGLGLCLFVLVALGLSMYFNVDVSKVEYINIILGVLENYVLFVIGYNAFRLQNLNLKFYYILLCFLIITCFITIVNYVTGQPAWYAPSQYLIESEAISANRIFEKYSLYQTGFSWSRNGWGTTVALYLPLLLYLYSTKKRLAIWGYGILFISIFLCGTRNGVLAALVPLSIYIYMNNKFRHKSNVRVFVTFAVISFIVALNFMSISKSMRLDGTNISSGRIEQYVLIPLMLGDMGFWGIGLNGTQYYIYKAVGEVHSLHNTFFNTLIELGVLVGGVVGGIMILAIKYIIKSLRSYDINTLCWGLILAAGLLTTLFEPRMVFGNLGGCCLWWFSFGFLKAKFERGKYE